MSKRRIKGISNLIRRPQIWMVLALAILLIFIQAFPPTPVRASEPEIAGRIFHNPIVIGGSVSDFLLKAAITPDIISPPFTPAQIRKAYGIDQIPNNGAGKTIAIIDAYGDASIVQDLHAFDVAFGLSDPVLEIYPSASLGTDSNWAMETALDVEWAHAIAPGAKILLVVAPSANASDLLVAVDYATAHGADIVSMSWGGSEFKDETNNDSYFNHSGVTYLASSGDAGAGVLWPASSQYVVAVGGTSLSIKGDGTYGSETAWSGSGGGQSAYVPKPSYQSGLSGSYRLVPDVAFDANPSSGVKVLYNGNWYTVGGTSLSAPCWAGLYALADRSGVPWVYSQAASGLYAINYHDVTSGSNGNPAGSGYDMVTGLGSPIFNNLAYGPATKIGFSTQPSDSITGIPFTTSPVVTVQDSNNNTVTSYNSPVALTITSGTGATDAVLSGISNISAVGGIATFNGLSINKAAMGYTLTASSGALTPANSNSFNVIGVPSKLAFTTQPSSSTTGVPFATQPVVAIQDSAGNIITNSSASVFLSITAGTGTEGATLSGVISNVSAVGGMASFSGLSIDRAGTGYTLNASAVGLETIISNTFNITSPVLPASSGGGGGGGGGASTGATLDYLNQFLNNTGTFTRDASVRTFDSKAIISFPKGTKFNISQNQSGSYVSTKAIKTGEPTPPKDGNIIGLPYQLGPEGATFDPPVTLKMIYDPSQIPSGVDENNLKIGYWDGNMWQVQDSTVDSANHTVITQINHFSEYAVISVPPPAFSLSSLKITPDKVNPGETTTIETVLSNTGGSPGSLVVVLKVNGAQVNSKQLSLDPGKSETVTFQLQKEVPGEYKLDINGQTGQFSVATPPLQQTIEPNPTMQPLITEPISTTSPTAGFPTLASAPPVATFAGAGGTFPILWVIIIFVAIAGVSIGLIAIRKRGK
jgi:hypothetical protein